MTALEAVKTQEKSEEEVRDTGRIGRVLSEIHEEYGIFGKRLSALLENSSNLEELMDGLPKLRRSSADLKAALKKLSSL